ncbi:uncharacterized protein K02A2.6-like [Rhagoletis pomonella]|uniref:uncharacterized protein K02A2.6-like n=1 Tax=Rhagoletis pomonella TaxID=28610 RepID=UPI001786A73B|nr:uncharacterized protein K02A2.6-like [Rhagoletis pomonella]
MANENFAALLEQQQQFTKALIVEQQKWMQSFVERTAGSGRSASESVNCPPFHNFNKDLQNWESYTQQLTQHFLAYSVGDEEKKKAYFLSWIGSDVYELLKNLFGTDILLTFSYKQLIDKLTEQFQMKRHIVAARYDFFKRTMKDSQTHRDWVADLKGIARECHFVCSTAGCTSNFVDDMIRDQIIVHTPYDSVRVAALQKLQPKLEDVLVIAETYETTTKTVATIKENSEKAINYVQANKQQSKTKSGELPNKSNLKSCTGCGQSHSRDKCKFRNANCHNCGRKGHIAAVCMKNKNKKNHDEVKSANNKNKVASTQKHKAKSANTVDAIEEIYSLTGVVKVESNKNIIDVELLNKIVAFQMDSGATVSVFNYTTYKQLNSPQLTKCNRILHAFGQQPIPILGELNTVANCGNKSKQITLILTSIEKCNNLFGLDLFKAFAFEIQQVSNVEVELTLQITELSRKYKEVFEPALGAIKDFKASVVLKPNATPKFYKSRQIPFAQMAKFKAEANRLTEAGIWKPIKFSNWASPIVLAPKPDGSIRICGDFKQAVNSQIDVEQYPLPTREALLHKIRQGKHFSKIDLKDAYLQMMLDEPSKQIMVVNTPLGLFQYQRLPYGIASAPAIFQRYLEQLLTGIEGCGNYLDDIIITAPTTEQHISRVEQILKILQDNGIRCKKEKCSFFQTEMEYLGRRINANGILPDHSGIQAVKALQPSANLRELEAFMGKVNYYHNFIPNYSQLAAPLNQLRRKGVPFKWGAPQQEAFTALKNHILNATQLSHFNESLPLVLATDASSFGIGVVLSHIHPDGCERPIAFASKTLDKHQVKYSQIEKEGLSIIFGVKRFNQYLYGRKFTLITDHKPLVTIFNPSKHLPLTTTNRLQRWAVILMAYNFDIKYRATTAHGNADALSRLPMPTDENFDKQENCYNITSLSPPINAAVIQERRKADNLLKKPNIIKMLHEGHWGIVRMKQLARQYVWWPGVDADITQQATGCNVCKRNNPAPVSEYQNWPKATTAWERIHIDFAGPIFGSMWLTCVDAYSQFPFVTQMPSTTTENTITALSAIFAIEGYPKTLVSDNGPQLISDVFQQFCKLHGIAHNTIAPFHPASNGLAERFVQSFKTSVSKNIQDGLPTKSAVLRYLASYRFAPNLNGKTPAELLHGRPVRTLLSQLFEHPRKATTNQKHITKYEKNQKVYARNYAKGEKWVEAIINRKVGNMMYIVQTLQGYLKRHVNQLKLRQSATNEVTPNNLQTYDTYPTVSPSNSHRRRSSEQLTEQHATPAVEIVPQNAELPSSNNNNATVNQDQTPRSSNQPESGKPLRRSNRIRRGVNRYSPPYIRK